MGNQARLLLKYLFVVLIALSQLKYLFAVLISYVYLAEALPAVQMPNSWLQSFRKLPSYPQIQVKPLLFLCVCMLCCHWWHGSWLVGGECESVTYRK